MLKPSALAGFWALAVTWELLFNSRTLQDVKIFPGLVLKGVFFSSREQCRMSRSDTNKRLLQHLAPAAYQALALPETSLLFLLIFGYVQYYLSLDMRYSKHSADVQGCFRSSVLIKRSLQQSKFIVRRLQLGAFLNGYWTINYSLSCLTQV